MNLSSDSATEPDGALEPYRFRAAGGKNKALASHGMTEKRLFDQSLAACSLGV